MYLSYDTISIGASTVGSEGRKVKEVDKHRIYFTATFSGVRPDLAFSRMSKTPDPDYDYGPIVVLVKKLEITLPSGMDISTSLKSFSINGKEVNISTTCSVTKLEDKEQYRITHMAPPIISDLDESKFDTDGKPYGTEGIDYLDLTDMTGSFKYFLFDPMDILVRAYYSEDYLNSLTQLQLDYLSSEVRKLDIEKRYNIDDFEWKEIEPLRFYDFWLPERLFYLFNSFVMEEGEVGNFNKGHHWPSPFEIYQRHKPPTSQIGKMSLISSNNSNLMPQPSYGSGLGSKVNVKDGSKKTGPLLQEMRWAYFYMLGKEMELSTSVIKRQFAYGFKKNPSMLDILAWDGVPVERGKIEGTSYYGYKPPKAKEVRLVLNSERAPICYGCNRHPTWELRYESGCEVDNYECIPCDRPIPIEDIPKVGPEIKVEETRQLDIGKFPTIMERSMFDKFFVISIGIDNSSIHFGGECWKQPYVPAVTAGSVRVVPEVSDLRDFISAEYLSGHIEICPRLVMENGGWVNEDLTSEQDGYILTPLKFGVNDTNTGPSDRYPFEYVSEKTLRDQMREITNNLDWCQLNIIKVKVHNSSKIPNKVLAKRAYKSIDKIYVAEIYIIEEIFSGSGGSGEEAPKPERISCPKAAHPMVEAGISPVFACCPVEIWVSPVTGAQSRVTDRRCPCYSMDGVSVGGGGGTQVIHAFGVFQACPFPEWFKRQPAWYLQSIGFRAIGLDMKKKAKTQAALYIGTTHVSLTEKSPTSKCLPGMIGPGLSKITTTWRRDTIPMEELEVSDAITLFEQIAAPAINFVPGPGECPFPGAPALYSPYTVVTTYGQKTYSLSGPEYSIDPISWSGHENPYYYAWLGIGFCCDENPGTITGWRHSEDSGHYYGTKSSGKIFLNALTYGKYIYTGADTWCGSNEFDYSCWCDHHFRIVDGVYMPCRCN